MLQQAQQLLEDSEKKASEIQEKFEQKLMKVRREKNDEIRLL
jgi:hypothetical protein